MGRELRGALFLTGKRIWRRLVGGEDPGIAFIDDLFHHPLMLGNLTRIPSYRTGTTEL